MDKREKELLDRIGKDAGSIKLPEALSKENIRDLIDDKEYIPVVKPEKKRDFNYRLVVRAAVSVAAAIAIVFGIAAVAKTPAPPVEVVKGNNTQASVSGYEEIENAAVEYYKNNIYTEANRYSGIDLFGKKKSNTAGIAVDEALVEEWQAVPASPASSAADTAVNTAASSLQSQSFGKTNIQVDGVDEADVIKTDGKYIYIVRQGCLSIIDASDKEHLKTVYDGELFGLNENQSASGSEMFIKGSRLVIISEIYEMYAPQTYNNGKDKYVTCCCIAASTSTRLTVLDISDKTSPKTEFTYDMDGSYTSSRLIGDKLIFVANYGVPYNYIQADSEEGACDVVKDICIPQYSINGSENIRIPAENIDVTNKEEPVSYVVTAVMDINDCENTLTSSASLGNSTSVYCTSEYLFVARERYGYWDNGGDHYYDIDGENFDCVTEITSYDISGNKAVKKNTATVPGRCIGQFSMDYFNGYFRMAMTMNIVDNYWKTVNRVYVLDKDMKVVGKTETFGTGENMYAARFLGNYAYIVTFLQTDPLFVIDLTVPEKPVIAGEVKLPGFSSYLHPIGNGLVIGVGTGGTENGTDGSAKLSLFDVTDPKKPKELDSIRIENAYFDTDSKAFLTIDGRNEYSVVYTQYGYSSNYSYSSMHALVFSVKDGKLVKSFESAPIHDMNGCLFGRTTYIGDTLFLTNGFAMISADMNKGTMLDSIAF